MDVVCNRCGVTFASIRKDARYCSPRCRTQAHRAKVAHPGPKRPRPPLWNTFMDATSYTDRSIQRLVRLSKDDRVSRNRAALAQVIPQRVRQMIADLQSVVDNLEP